MESGIHLSSKARVRNHSKKIKEKKEMIVAAEHVRDFQIKLFFSNGKSKMIDFLPLFSKHVKGEMMKYFSPERFKKFIVKQGNIYWGRNEDVIFPVHLLLKNGKDTPEENEEVLYVI